MKGLLGTILFIVIAISCGNPHLKNPDKLVPNKFMVLDDPFKDIIVRDSDGDSDLDVITSEDSINSILGQSNPNKEEILVSYEFENGTHFRWNGGTFPGANGSCKNEQPANTNCNLDIEFHADLPGVYLDNLLITYTLKSAPSKKTVKKVPLRGERTADNIIPIIITPVTGETDVQIETDDKPESIQINQQNPNSDEVIVTYHFEKGENFRFRGGHFPGTSGTCGPTQLPNENCSLDIEFHAEVPGRYTDELIATYALKSNPLATKEVRLPLVGVKLNPPSTSLVVRPMKAGGFIDLGSAPLHSPTRTDGVIIENNGNTNQKIEIALGRSGMPFTLSHNCPQIIIPATQCKIDVSYESTQIGTHNTQIVVNQNLAIIPVTATTTALPLTPGKIVITGMDGGYIDFGTVDAGSVNSRLVEIQNIGQTSVSIGLSPIVGEGFSYNGGNYPGQRGSCGQTILPGKCLIDVSFAPPSVGSYSGMITLTTSQNNLTVGLIGKARKERESCYRLEERRVNAKASGNPSGITFPYLASASGTTAKITKLYGTTTNERVVSLNRRVVKDAMVYVTFNMPHIGEEILDIDVNMDVTKVIMDGHADTESLCISANGLRKCSGREFTLDRWKRLKNPAFWSNQSTITTLYEDEFAKGTSVCGNFSCYTMVKNLSAKEMFLLTKNEFQGLSGKSLHLIFSDDTRLRTMPSLTIKTKKPVACK